MAQVSNFVTLVIMFFFQLDLLQCHNLKLQKPIISPECKLVGICDSVENYPTQLVKGLIDKLKSENTIFNYEEEPLTKTTYRSGVDKDLRTTHKNKNQERIFYNVYASPYIPTGYTYMYVNNPNGIRKPWYGYGNPFFSFNGPSLKPEDRKKRPLSLCETETQLLPPKSAIDINGNWQFIINDSEEPVQVFRIETCRTPTGRCSENIDFIPGYDGACIQKMVFREMYYVNETEEIDRTFFKVPTCCSCVLVRKDNYK